MWTKVDGGKPIHVFVSNSESVSKPRVLIVNTFLMKEMSLN